MITVKDWDKIKDAFIIPQNPLELEKEEICLLHEKKRTPKRKVASETQGNLFLS